MSEMNINSRLWKLCIRPLKLLRSNIFAYQPLSNEPRLRTESSDSVFSAVSPNTPETAPSTLIERIYLGRDRTAAKMKWGGWVVVPTFNIDVAVGALRDGIIEPWTTRVVQEILRPGDLYVNGGANFGYYTMLGGSIVGVDGMVFAIDANPHIIPYIALGMFWNGTPKQTRIFLRALSDTSNKTVKFRFDPQFLGSGATLDDFLPPTYLENERDIRKRTINECIWSFENIADVLGADGYISQSNLNIDFETKTITIDDILCSNSKPVSLIHLDIEGAEALALAGAKETIRRSPKLRIITEWSASHFKRYDEKTRKIFLDVWDFLTVFGYQVRRIEPYLAPDGGIYVSDLLDLEHMIHNAIHCDYIWIKKDQDPWSVQTPT